MANGETTAMNAGDLRMRHWGAEMPQVVALEGMTVANTGSVTAKGNANATGSDITLEEIETGRGRRREKGTEGIAMAEGLHPDALLHHNDHVPRAHTLKSHGQGLALNLRLLSTRQSPILRLLVF
jgi:hypothetical protein